MPSNHTLHWLGDRQRKENQENDGIGKKRGEEEKGGRKWMKGDLWEKWNVVPLFKWDLLITILYSKALLE